MFFVFISPVIVMSPMASILFAVTLPTVMSPSARMSFSTKTLSRTFTEHPDTRLPSILVPEQTVDEPFDKTSPRIMLSFSM